MRKEKYTYHLRQDMKNTGKFKLKLKLFEFRIL